MGDIHCGCEPLAPLWVLSARLGFFSFFSHFSRYNSPLPDVRPPGLNSYAQTHHHGKVIYNSARTMLFVGAHPAHVAITRKHGLAVVQHVAFFTSSSPLRAQCYVPCDTSQ
jgi:hypothetical protein